MKDSVRRAILKIASAVFRVALWIYQIARKMEDQQGVNSANVVFLKTKRVGAFCDRKARSARNPFDY